MIYLLPLFLVVISVKAVPSKSLDDLVYDSITDTPSQCCQFITSSPPLRNRYANTPIYKMCLAFKKYGYPLNMELLADDCDMDLIRNLEEVQGFNTTFHIQIGNERGVVHSATTSMCFHFLERVVLLNSYEGKYFHTRLIFTIRRTSHYCII